LIERFGYIMTAIEEGQDVSTLTLGGLMGSLCLYEQRMNQKSIGSNLKQALQSGVAPSSRGGYQNSCCHGRGRGRGGNLYLTENYQTCDKSKVKCFKCNKFGHYRSKCQANVTYEQAK